MSGGADPTERVTVGNTLFTVLNTGSVTVESGGIFDGTITAGVGGSISQAAVGASGSATFSNVVDGATSTLAPATYSIGTQTFDVKNTGGAVSITADIGSVGGTGLDTASIAGGINNSISVSGVGASGSTSFNNTYTGGTSGGTPTGPSGTRTYAIAALSTDVRNTGTVSVTSTSYGASIGGGVNGSISSAAVGASASTSFSVITR